MNSLAVVEWAGSILFGASAAAAIQTATFDGPSRSPAVSFRLLLQVLALRPSALPGR